MECAISSDLLARLRASAAATPGVEVCGLLFGSGAVITDAAACTNVAADPATAFEIDPAALLAAHRAARAGGPAIIGHYHSHPTGAAIPSPRDAAAARPDGGLWLILSPGAARLWRATEHGALHGRFDPVAMPMTRACADPARSSEGPPHHAIGDGMTISPVDFASILCSRLCHDLLSPVGALNNGLELLADEHDPAMRDRCMELLNESARTSAAKLKFFRLAFGAGGGFGETIDARESRAAIEALVAESKRTQLQWLVEEPALSKAATKVLLNLALVAIEGLVRGGTLSIAAENADAGTEIVLRAEGPRLVIDPDVRQMLVAGPGPAGVTSRGAGAFLAFEITRQAGSSVRVADESEGVLLFGATLPAQ